MVNTAWAVLALIAAGYHVRDAAPVQAGVAALLAAQLPSGDWPQQHISGVFNRNCMITYANYRRAPFLGSPLPLACLRRPWSLRCV